MADFQQKNDLDLRFGGSTLGDFGYFYDVELPWLFKCINSLRRNQETPDGETVAPVPNQIKVEDNGIYIRDAENQNWIFLMWQSYKGGFVAQGETLLKNTDLASGSTLANKVAVYDANGNIPSNVTGNAAQMAGHNIDATGLEDGQVMAYNAGTGTWKPADRYSGVGQGRPLVFYDQKGAFMSYTGGANTDVDLPVAGLHPNTSYAYGDVANTSQLPSNIALVCVVAGTTGNTIPSLT